MYIDELASAVKSLVQRFYDTHEGCKYMEAVQQAQSKEDSFKGPTAPYPENPYNWLHW